MSTAPNAPVHPARRPLIVWIWILTALIAATAVALVFAIRGDLTLAQNMPNEIRLETASSLGEDPFSATPLAAAPDPAIALATSAASVKPAPAGTSGGGTPGLYGGSNDLGRCDVVQLEAFLGSNPDKAKAWVDALNRDPLLRWEGGTLTTDDIPDYIDSLTSIILVSDTRVTNHGYYEGTATPLQSVLQKGTAVLVDKYGVPRAKCFCGNPLLPPQQPGKPFNPGTVSNDPNEPATPGVPVKRHCVSVPGTYEPVCTDGGDPNESTSYVGDPWEDFDPAKVVEVESVETPIEEFEVRIPATPEGDLTTIPVGSDSVTTPEPDPAAATEPNGPPTAPVNAGCSPVSTVGYVATSMTVKNDSARFVDVYFLGYEPEGCVYEHRMTLEPGASYVQEGFIDNKWAATAGSAAVVGSFTMAADGATWTIE